MTKGVRLFVVFSSSFLSTQDLFFARDLKSLLQMLGGTEALLQELGGPCLAVVPWTSCLLPKSSNNQLDVASKNRLGFGWKVLFYHIGLIT